MGDEPLPIELILNIINMKNLILTICAVAAGSVAVAQTPQVITAPVQQSSPTAAATVGGNYSNIDQKGQGSDALVQQQGTANASFIEQTGTNAANRNSVDVLQWGNVQPSISGHLNYSDIKQNGEGNSFTVTQQGDLNEVFGSSDGVDNTALVQQGADLPQQAESNLAIVDQMGTLNDAEVQQRWDNSEATISQDNSGAATALGNRSYQEQLANPNGSNGHTAIGVQYGDDNELIQLQEGPGSGNYAEANQGDGTTEATGAFAQQVQLGEGNEAYADQMLVNDVSYQEQIGTGNTAVVEQNLIGLASGGDNYVEQYQEGADNVASSKQAGNNNEAYQEQYQDRNSSSILQTHGQFGGNIAVSIQDGFDNSSMISQRASNNMSMVDQTGNGQMSVINQNNPITPPVGTEGNNSATVIQRNANVLLTPQVRRAAATVRHNF